MKKLSSYKFPIICTLFGLYVAGTAPMFLNGSGIEGDPNGPKAKVGQGTITVRYATEDEKKRWAKEDKESDIDLDLKDAKQIVINNSTIKKIDVAGDIILANIDYKDLMEGYKATLSKYGKADRKKRYDIPEYASWKKHPIKIWSHKGGKVVDKEKMQSTIEGVLYRMPIASNSINQNVVKFLQETAAVESNYGIFMKQVGGPARGIYQMEPKTYSELTEFLKTNAKDVYESVKGFYIEDQSLEWNMTNNIPYNTAMAVAYLWRIHGVNYERMCDTKFKRAMLYKLTWNTMKGKSTLKKYYKDTAEYNV